MELTPENIDRVTEEYLAATAKEVVNKDQPAHLHRTRTSGALAQYRAAARSFADCVKAAGRPVSELPENFLTTSWVRSQSCAAIQLRQRGYALRHEMSWLQSNGYSVPPFTPVVVAVPKPPKAPKPAAAPAAPAYHPDSYAAQESDVNEETFDQQGGGEAPPPSYHQPQMAPPPPPPQQQVMIPPPPSAPVPPPVMQPPPGAALPTYQQRNKHAKPQAQAPQPQAVAQPDPFAGMFPNGAHKLRVRRERDLEDPAWIGDYPSDQVRSYGAIEPFLAKLLPRVAPSLPPGTTEITFLVSSVGPYGEGDRARFTLSVPMGAAGSSAQAQAHAHAAAANSATVQPAFDQVDAINMQRRLLDGVEDRIVERVVSHQPQQPLGGFNPQPQQVPAAPAAMPDLPPSITNLIGRLIDKVDELNSRVQHAETREPPAMMQPQQPQLDVIQLLKAVREMARPEPIVNPQPVQQAPSMLDMLGMVERMQQLSRPQAVNIDVSPLEDRINDLQEKLEKAGRRSEIEDFATKMESLQRIFGGNPLMGASQKQGRSLGETLVDGLGMLIQNAPTIADSVERIVNTTASAKAEVVRAAVREKVNAQAALRQGVPQIGMGAPAAPAPAAPAPEERRQTRPPIKPVDRPDQKLKPAIVAAIKKTLASTDKKEAVTNVWDLMQKMGDDADTRAIVTKVEGFILGGEIERVTWFLGEVLQKLGFAASATPEKMKFLFDCVVEQLVADGTLTAEGGPAAEETEEEPQQEEEEGGNGPEINVRVGGGAPTEEQHEVGGDEEEAGGEEEESEEESEEETEEEDDAEGEEAR